MDRASLGEGLQSGLVLLQGLTLGAQEATA